MSIGILINAVIRVLDGSIVNASRPIDGVQLEVA